MLEQIAEKIENELKDTDTALFCNYAPGYQAVASFEGDIESDYYMIRYFKTTEEMPPFNAETFANITDCVKEMVKISAEWQEVEVDEG